MATIGRAWADGTWNVGSWAEGAWEGGTPAISPWETALLITCTTCGKQWEKADTIQMRYFRSATFTSYGSPATIVAAGDDMTYCPSCDSGHLAKASEALGGGQAALDIRTNPDGLDSERASTGGADVVHDSTNQTRS